MIPPEEHRHLVSGPRPGERAGGVGTVMVLAECAGGAATVLARSREVMEVVVDHPSHDWPGVEEWRRLLPRWFVEACVEESDDEADRWLAQWRGLPPDERAAAEERRPWALADWLFWVHPSERQWFWWDATVEDSDRVRVEVEVVGWPQPLGALFWLLRAAGAVSATVHEDAPA